MIEPVEPPAPISSGSKDPVIVISLIDDHVQVSCSNATNAELAYMAYMFNRYLDIKIK
jgi:hypothetical protein